MRQHNAHDSRNCWKTARERERMKARFSIRQRVASLALAPADDWTSEEGCSALTVEERETIKWFLRRIEEGSASSFSLTALSKHHNLLSRPIPTALLSPFKITTLCTSRFGKQYAERIHFCVKHLETCSLMEYATWLGEYRILGSLLVAGFDPTMKGTERDNSQQYAKEWLVRSQTITARVLQRFFDEFSLPLSCYIVKRVIDMRKEGIVMRIESGDRQMSSCPICHSNQSETLVCFGNPCQHVFCEHCLWENILDNVNGRSSGDVVLCPICGKSPEMGSTSKSPLPADDEPSDPASRCQESLSKFNALPANSKELKARPKKKSFKKGLLASSWSAAVLPSLGNSQNVRRDKWFLHTERNAIHHVRGCLVAGVNVNFTNEYGQTALYIAAWRGYSNLVELLLEYGANGNIRAHGGSSVQSISEVNGPAQILEVLKRFDKFLVANEGVSPLFKLKKDCIDPNSDFPSCIQHPQKDATADTFTRLIDPSRDHPGANAFYVDNCLPESVVNELLDLWRSIPVDPFDKKKDRQAPCSDRSYYCDAEGYICRLLSDAINQCCDSDDLTKKNQPIVFPHMRFLHYAHPGSVLAPHVDLSRVDLNGYRSTHTFILYLTNCETGGETCLLQGLSPGEQHILARVAPRRGRLFLFPHSCPHQGNEVQSVPKILLRGEVMLPS